MGSAHITDAAELWEAPLSKKGEVLFAHGLGPLHWTLAYAFHTVVPRTQPKLLLRIYLELFGLCSSLLLAERVGPRG